MMLIIARDPDIAIFVKTVTNVQKNLLKFALGFIWLFIGKIVEPFIISLHDHPKNLLKMKQLTQLFFTLSGHGASLRLV